MLTKSNEPVGPLVAPQIACATVEAKQAWINWAEHLAPLRQSTQQAFTHSHPLHTYHCSPLSQTVQSAQRMGIVPRWDTCPWPHGFAKQTGLYRPPLPRILTCKCAINCRASTSEVTLLVLDGLKSTEVPGVDTARQESAQRLTPRALGVGRMTRTRARRRSVSCSAI